MIEESQSQLYFAHRCGSLLLWERLSIIVSGILQLQVIQSKVSIWTACECPLSNIQYVEAIQSTQTESKAGPRDLIMQAFLG